MAKQGTQKSKAQSEHPETPESKRLASEAAGGCSENILLAAEVAVDNISPPGIYMLEHFKSHHEMCGRYLRIQYLCLEGEKDAKSGKCGIVKMEHEAGCREHETTKKGTWKLDEESKDSPCVVISWIMADKVEEERFLGTRLKQMKDELNALLPYDRGEDIPACLRDFEVKERAPGMYMYEHFRAGDRYGSYLIQYLCLEGERDASSGKCGIVQMQHFAGKRDYVTTKTGTWKLDAASTDSPWVVISWNGDVELKEEIFPGTTLKRMKDKLNALVVGLDRGVAIPKRLRNF
jgi:hypothetical protein